MKTLFVTISIICLILMLQLDSISAARSIVDPNLTQGDIDAYKENYNDPNLLNKKGEMYYQKLLSSDFTERNHAVFFFSHFKKEELNERILKSATDLLKKEFEREKIVEDLFRKGRLAELGKDLAYVNSENFGMYHLYLCRIVGKSGDKNSLTLLVNYCPMPEVLVNFGDDAVEPILDVLRKTTNPFGKSNAISVLGEMLKPKKEGYIASGQIRNKIKKALEQFVYDENDGVRQGAVRALGDSEDADVIPILKKVATSDPKHFEKKDHATGKMTTRYPVREEAEKALSKIKEKEGK